MKTNIPARLIFEFDETITPVADRDAYILKFLESKFDQFSISRSRQDGTEVNSPFRDDECILIIKNKISDK